MLDTEPLVLEKGGQPLSCSLCGRRAEKNTDVMGTHGVGRLELQFSLDKL